MLPSLVLGLPLCFSTRYRCPDHRYVYRRPLTPCLVSFGPLLTSILSIKAILLSFLCGQGTGAQHTPYPPSLLVFQSSTWTLITNHTIFSTRHLLYSEQILSSAILKSRVLPIEYSSMASYGSVTASRSSSPHMHFVKQKRCLQQQHWNTSLYPVTHRSP